MKIMIADDDQSLRLLVQCIIEDDGYDCCSAADGSEAVKVCLEEHPDLLVLDIMMPKLDGFQVCRTLREAGYDAPILFLSARGDIVDKSAGFTMGGDDYLVKPFDPKELSLRINALLRRAAKGASAGVAKEEMVVGKEITIDPKRRKVIVRGDEADITPKEFQILYLLACLPGEVVTQETIVRSVWGEEYSAGSLNLAVYIRHIREKIEIDPSQPQILQTVWGAGYRYSD